ncbi:SURF1 family protein [Nocardioidaceae bacterium]|nr:SURF1 family protein [Nocardioidaceae bacterium]
MQSMARILLGRRTLGATALLVVALAIFSGLGLWQLEGWQAQRAAEERDLSTRPPVPLTQVIGADDPFPGDDVGRPVTVHGTWLPDTGFVVGPRPLRGRDGWWVVAVAVLEDTGAPDRTETSVPVVLGWSPDPDPASPSGPVDLTGFLQPGEGSLARDDDPTDRRFPELRLASLTEIVPVDLVSAFVVADDEPTLALPAVPPEDVPPVGASTALRNLLYALQWFVLALGALVVWGRFLREELAGPETVPR